jgi:hypothetical protein
MKYVRQGFQRLIWPSILSQICIFNPYGKRFLWEPVCVIASHVLEKLNMLLSNNYLWLVHCIVRVVMSLVCGGTDCLSCAVSNLFLWSVLLPVLLRVNKMLCSCGICSWISLNLNWSALIIKYEYKLSNIIQR